jgi:hypothetical protein
MASAAFPRTAAPPSLHDGGMSYAVVWQDEDSTVYAGKLELGERLLRLDGLSAAGIPHRLALAYDELGAVRSAGRRERIGDRPTLLVERPARPPLKLVSVGGSGLLPELADRLVAHTLV